MYLAIFVCMLQIRSSSDEKFIYLFGAGHLHNILLWVFSKEVARLTTQIIELFLFLLSEPESSPSLTYIFPLSLFNHAS